MKIILYGYYLDAVFLYTVMYIAYTRICTMPIDTMFCIIKLGCNKIFIS